MNTTMKKAILIDPFDNTVKEVSVGDFRDIQSKIGCSVFTCVRFPDGNVAYVDDEGLINGTTRGVRFVKECCSQHFLAGRVLILGDSPDGDSADCTWSRNEAWDKVAHFISFYY